MESHAEPLPRPYESAAAAVAAEVARMALVLRRALRRLRHRELQPAATATGRFDAAGAERELQRLEHPADRAPALVDGEADKLTTRIETRRHSIARDRAATRIPLPLYELADRAGLSPLAFDLFLLALAPEIDDGFGRLFQFLRGGASARGRALDVATAARILSPTDPGADAVRRALAPGAALADLGLLALSNDGSAAQGCTMATTLSVPPAVVAHVLGQELQEPALRGLLVERPELLPRERTFLPDELWPYTTALIDDAHALPLLEGPTGAGKRLLVRALAHERGCKLVELDLTTAPAAFGAAEALAAARLAWLTNAWIAVALPQLDADAPRAQRTWQPGVTELLSRFPGRVILTRDALEPAHLDLALATTRRLSPVLVPAPERDRRAELWRDRLGAGADALDYDLLARTYPITGGVITRIAGEARIRARARAERDGTFAAGDGQTATADVTLPDVMAAIDAEFRPILSTVGRRLTTRATHADLIISDETRETLGELESTIRLRDTVLDEWNFRRLVRGRGVSALFYGDPGTGKTMAAGVIAAAAGLPLYQIDTATLVSKWVGETEKNLAEVFRAAEAGHAMLLFDEADAIFGKRTDVQNSTDRYANMQTNFLLTQIELFNGISILTTNRESVMDQAFQRRLTFRVHFPMPEEIERDRLWRQMLSGHSATTDEIAFGELARRLQMSGGYIRNAVMRAGYLAAAAGSPITTQLLRHAAELVLRDAGKVI
ncbi:MAG TPA: AAA family ATPase [Polyangia bacterium]|nr:AAA family ATPase [Polyangia bacterium]